MQRYLQRNFEIIAIMDSEVERFFPTASVNTTIVILKRQRNEEKREKNTVKFVYFLSTLQQVIKAYKNPVKLKEIIEKIKENESNEYFRINCVNQKELAEHTKWTQFLKAPKVYFDILKKGKWKSLGGKNGIADIKYGIKTGNNHFFLLKNVTSSKTDFLKAAVNNKSEFWTAEDLKAHNLSLVENGFNELWLIENELLTPVLTSPKDINAYIVKPSALQNKILLIDDTKVELKKKYPFAFEYIKYGERRNIHFGSTLASRKLWYNLGERELPTMSFSYMINDFGRTYLGKVFTNDNFQNIYVNRNRKTLYYYLNSTIAWFFQQIIIRTNFGDGVGKIQSYEFADLLVPIINLENLNINLGETKNYKEELGSLETLKTVNPERLKLDSAILEAIGYKQKKEREEVLLELYRSTFQLIDARLKKAQSQKGVKAQRNKVEFSVYVEQLKTMLQEANIPAKNTLTFAKQINKLISEITSESKLQTKILTAYWKEKFGEVYDEKKVADKMQGKMF